MAIAVIFFSWALTENNLSNCYKSLLIAGIGADLEALKLSLLILLVLFN